MSCWNTLKGMVQISSLAKARFTGMIQDFHGPRPNDKEFEVAVAGSKECVSRPETSGGKSGYTTELAVAHAVPSTGITWPRKTEAQGANPPIRESIGSSLHNSLRLASVPLEIFFDIRTCW